MPKSPSFYGLQFFIFEFLNCKLECSKYISYQHGHCNSRKRSIFPFSCNPSHAIPSFCGAKIPLYFNSVGIILNSRLAIFPESFLIFERSAKLWPAYPDSVFIAEPDVVFGTIYFIHKNSLGIKSIAVPVGVQSVYQHRAFIKCIE